MIIADCELVNMLEDGLFTVVAENVELCSCSELVPAFLCFFASFYVFQLSYPKTVTNTMMFIQKALFNLHDSSKNPKRVLSPLNKLNAN